MAVRRSGPTEAATTAAGEQPAGAGRTRKKLSTGGLSFRFGWCQAADGGGRVLGGRWLPPNKRVAYPSELRGMAAPLADRSRGGGDPDGREWDSMPKKLRLPSFEFSEARGGQPLTTDRP